MSETSRIQTIKAELDKSRDEYIQLKDKFEEFRVKYETAREKFTKVVELAGEMLPYTDWFGWLMQNVDLRFVGLSIGDAIIAVLKGNAYQAAQKAVNENKPFAPAMNLSTIAQELENGGFAFQSSTPRREVNAALINLKGITRIEQGAFQIETADEIMQEVAAVHTATPARPTGLVNAGLMGPSPIPSARILGKK
jgi:hypothetical protein